MSTRYSTLEVDGVNLFYREAGDPKHPTIVLLHGFPSSSHMFRNLIPVLGEMYHVLAPDYPGFGYSSAPSPDEFDYTFDRLSEVVEHFLQAKNVERYSLYMQDYGGPIGFRLATRNPDAIDAIIVQNAIAHMQGVSENMAPLAAYWAAPQEHEPKIREMMLTLAATQFQYLHGASDVTRVSPDAWTFDQALLDRPGNDRIQLALLYDYRNNPAHFETWQRYLREHKPPMLIAWGKNDPFFTVEGAYALADENPRAKLLFLDGGHFALEEHLDTIAYGIFSLQGSVAAKG